MKSKEKQSYCFSQLLSQAGYHNNPECCVPVFESERLNLTLVRVGMIGSLM